MKKAALHDRTESFFFFKLFNWRLITILWWFLPHVDMNQRWVYMYSPVPNSPLTSLPIPSLWLSQCTGFECPISCIKLGLVIYFTYDDTHVSMLFSQIIPGLPSPTESKSLFHIFVSFAVLHIGSLLPSF